MCGYHSKEATDNCRSVMKKENRNCNGEWFQRKTDNSAASYEFQARVTEGRKFFLMPDGCFFSYFSAFQHLVMLLRVFPKQRSWEFYNNLPSGWQVKTKLTWQFKTGVSSRPSGGPARSKSREGGWRSSPRLVGRAGRGGSRSPLCNRRSTSGPVQEDEEAEDDDIL